MTVELINNNTSNGILDLTGGQDNQDNKIIDGEVLDLTDNTPNSLDLPIEEDASVPDIVTDITDKPTALDEEAIEESEYYFGEQRVNVEVPEELESALKEAGIDSKDLISQLFKKDGDFSLDDETRAKLEDKFGKVMVDGYLKMYKGLNDQSLESHTKNQESEAKAFEQKSSEYSEAVGGNEGLELMESFIESSFKPEQIAAYNAVMESEDHASQIFIIGQIKAQMELTDKLVNGDKSIKLIGDSDPADNSSVTPLTKGFLSNNEYQKIMESDKYWDDKEYARKVEAARMAGIRQGQ